MKKREKEVYTAKERELESDENCREEDRRKG